MPTHLFNSRQVKEFLQSKTGKLTAFLLLLGLILMFLLMDSSGQPRVVESTSVPTPSAKTAETITQSFQPLAVTPAREQKPKLTRPPMDDRPRPEIKLPPIDLYTSDRPSISPVYAPYGRLVPCELVVTVDSSRIATPIIGLVTEDIWHDGRLVVPAGTEVHGSAQVDRSRERIASQSNWTLVWQDGRELKVTGIALDRSKTGESWSLTDGSAGLRGRIIKSDSLAEIKLFASTFLSAASVGFTDQQAITGPFGTTTVVEGTLKNAIATGAGDTLNLYAQQILDRIREDGFYVRVPAGSTFYLYVTQTLDQGDARVAGTQPKENRS